MFSAIEPIRQITADIAPTRTRRVAGERTAKESGPRAPRVLATLLILLGLVLAGGGARLAVLGGSLYYVIAGTALIASGVLLWRRRALGAQLYALLTLATMLWAVWESGFDAWALAPRVIPFLALGALLLRPGLRRVLEPATTRPLSRSPYTWAMALGLVVLVTGAALRQPYPVLPFPQTTATAASARSDWQHVGGTLAGTRYAPIEQITPSNVANLRVAWMHRTGVDGGFRATPLQVGNTLYLCTDGNTLEALDGDTGKAKWRFDPQLIQARTGFTKSCRGVSYHEDAAATDCPRRILTATADARLIAVNADTGMRCAGFGSNGEVDLYDGLGEVKPGSYYTTSPPTIARGVAVVGAWVSDGASVGMPSGVVRAFDVQTGRLRWAWDGASAEPVGELKDGAIYRRGTPNAWSIFSADEQLGLVYLPMGNATPDYFGTHRAPELEKYASSVVALELESGRVRWSFQTVHHDIWDYDVPSQPVLIDLPHNSARVPALIAPTKRGELFLLDRRSGEPLAPVEEWPVPQSDVPGERTAKTQPFSVGMPAFGREFVTEAKMWGITPIDQMFCRIAYRELRYEGPMTPPSLRGSLQVPGFAGGMNWGSVSVDEGHDVMLVNTLNMPTRVQLIPRAQVKTGGRSFVAPQLGTPYASKAFPFLSPIFSPCVQPPFGELAAVDLQSKKTLWRRPLGSANDLGPLGQKSHLPLPMGVINVGGTLTTKSGLVFVGGTLDSRLRAFDIHSGDVLWTAKLPNSGHATPMTFVSPATQRQYIVMTVPFADPLSALSPHAPATPASAPISDTGGWVIAYALPASHQVRFRDRRSIHKNERERT